MLNKSIFLTSNTNIRQDGKVHSYYGLRLADIPAVGTGTSSSSKYTHTHIRRRPKEGVPSRYAQLYFFDMQNEIRNRMSAFMNKETPETVEKNIVANLIQMFDQNSTMAKSFRMEKEWCRSHGDANFRLRLLSERTTTKQYKTPTRQNQGTTLLREGRLFQQYLVDAFTAIEEQRLNWTRNNQDMLRVDLYHNLCDAVTRGDTSAAGLGKRIVLPQTYIGSPRYTMHHYQDAMALCRTYNNPDLFITFTLNPKWPKIVEMLAYIPCQKSHDQLPCPRNDPDAYMVVSEFMLHGPCGAEAKHAPCTNEGKCSKYFPKKIFAETNINEDGYPIYHRRDNEITAIKGKFTYMWFLTIGPDRATISIQENVKAGASGASDQKDGRKINCATFKAACFAYGLLNDDKEWTYVIAEARFWVMAPQLHDLFVTVLLFCDKHYRYLELNRSDEQVRNYCLLEIQDLLNKHGKYLTDFKDLPQPNPKLRTNLDNHLLREELAFDAKKSKVEHEKLHLMLNPEQHLIYGQIIESVHNDIGQFCFIHGPGGTGKTFLYKTIIARLRSEQMIVLAIASSVMEWNEHRNGINEVME
nr:uncharacterized protein [Tanacetum cinerariifolium]